MRLKSLWLAPFLVLACGEPAGDDPNHPDATDTDSAGGSTNPLVDPTCIDGDFTEVLPNTTAGLSDASANFSASNPLPFLRGALEARYPTGRVLLDGGLQNTSFGDCVDLFTSPQQRASVSGLISALSTIVHECGHFHDLHLGGFSSAAYQFNADVLLTCSGGSMNDTPARSRITGDDYAALRPACPAQGEFGCDDYARIYLDGDPDDGSFDSGDQGFDMLLEETVQYIHSLATDYAFADQIGSGSQISARDGILTFLWYNERYLRWVRQNDRQAYNDLIGDACWREAILTAWGRAWRFLDATEGMTKLGIDDDDLLTLVNDPDLLAEIQRVREAEGCD